MNNASRSQSPEVTDSSQSHDGFLTEPEFWRYIHKSSVSVLISDKGVCRTAPATPGLLKIYLYSMPAKTAAT